MEFTTRRRKIYDSSNKGWERHNAISFFHYKRNGTITKSRL